MIEMFLAVFHCVYFFHGIFPPEIPVSSGSHQNPPKNITLTFDDGPHPVNTPLILDILAKQGIRATFFVLGNRIPQATPVLIRLAKEGHALGNHSYHHPSFPRLTTPVLIGEYLSTELEILWHTGIWSRYFRFPYGNVDPRIQYVHTGPVVAWNVDAYDWKAKNPKILAQKIISQVHPGSIILLHDIKKDTIEALPLIIEGLLQKGYVFVPLEDLFSERELSGKMLLYAQGKVKSLPKISKPLQKQPPESLWHPKGTEANEEAMRW